MEPRRIPRAEHPVSRKVIDPDTLRVLYRLKTAGHEAYVVGGAVRDILRGMKPKDFDVATSATPEQIRRLFPNSRIIGRRFRLVHVFFGPKNIEVATLRASAGALDAEVATDEEMASEAERAKVQRVLLDPQLAAADAALHADGSPVHTATDDGDDVVDDGALDDDVGDDDGDDDLADGDDADDEAATPPGGVSRLPADGDALYIRDDNAWGDVESDAFRRDFTINALFYDIRDFSLIDYVGGVEDVQAGLIRCIGEPATRFCEDPVRMLRAVKFAARFGYTIEPATDAALRACVGQIANASRFRVTEEVFRILTQAHRDQGLRLLYESGLLAAIYPEWVASVGEEGIEQTIEVLAAIEAETAHEHYLPIEVIAAALFIPLLGVIDLEREHFHNAAERVGAEVRRLAHVMELPRRLAAAVLTLLRGQLYLLYFAARQGQVRRYVQSHEFDYVWRLHDLAFGHERRLHGLHEVWLTARDAVDRPLGGWVDRPDRRDVFSFRGATGGGRRGGGEPASVLSRQSGGGGNGEGGGGGRRRRRRR